jgi:hypothetical protein
MNPFFLAILEVLSYILAFILVAVVVYVLSILFSETDTFPK